MILSRIEIENYKQFRGLQEFEIPSQSTVGVIGANGVGKTTLFEAIEWCLYNPSSIAAKDVRPRGYGGISRVAVNFERRDNGGTIRVERELRRNTTTAAVYQVLPDGEVEVLVQGSRQVTEYVASKLIGLSHTAFVSTFFTRQKELHFFGNMTDTPRRREVGRLLGLETIRVAQQSIAEDRKRANDESTILQRQYEEQSEGRDFAEEITTGESAVAEHQTGVTTALEVVMGSAVELQAAERALGETTALRDRDLEFSRQISIAEEGLRSSQRQQAGLTTEIQRLESRGAEREALSTLAARHEELAGHIREQEALRTRFNQRREKAIQAEALQRQWLDQVRNVRQTVIGISAPEISGWTWTPANDREPELAISRLLRLIDGLDSSSARQQFEGLVATFNLAQALLEAESKLQRYRERRQELDKQFGEMTTGEPDKRLAEIRMAQEKRQQERTQLRTEQSNLVKQSDQARQLITNLEQEQFGDACPTCARPFKAGEVEIVVVSLRDRVKRLDGESQEATRRVGQISIELDTADAERLKLEARLEQIRELRVRIETSQSYLTDQDQLVTNARADLGQALKVARLSAPPDEQAVQIAEKRVRLVELMLGTRETLAQAGGSIKGVAENQATVQAELDALGEVRFDEEHFRTLNIQFQQANAATATLQEIDRDLQRIPLLRITLEEERQRASELEQRIANLSGERAAIGFDASELERRVSAEQAARLAEREAVTGQHRAETALRDAEHRLNATRQDQERIKGLADRADARRKEFDQFDLMYREFTEFERFAANRITPVLSDITSELVRVITDGKYDRVEFDGNFGVQVFDGDEESFPLETFSGGERDAIALGARLALSRMIGSQATEQPGFLVLDEVFGSLDRDRRMRLLDLLGTISDRFEDFQQVFIISHVDDVRTSNVFNELWRIDERTDGASELTVLAPGEDVDDL